MSATVLVTGPTGKVGRRLIPRLADHLKQVAIMASPAARNITGCANRRPEV